MRSEELGVFLRGILIKTPCQNFLFFILYKALGEFPEWSNGADCKSVGSAFEGSNPPLPTKGNAVNAVLLFFCAD